MRRKLGRVDEEGENCVWVLAERLADYRERGRALVSEEFVQKQGMKEVTYRGSNVRNVMRPSSARRRRSSPVPLHDGAIVSAAEGPGIPE